MARKVGFIIVYNAIPALIAFVEANARVAVKKTADEIVRDAKARAPVRTGYLRSSIHADSVTAGKEATVSADAPYAAFVEYGTRHMSAQPFLGPAVTAHVDEFIEDMGRGMFASFRG